MPTESESEVEEMQRVRTDDGDTAPPASDAEAHVAESDIDIRNGGDGVTEQLVGPSRCSALFIHVEPDTDAEIEVRFLDAEGGDVVTKRTSADNNDFASASGADIFGTVAAPASRFFEVFIGDVSGGPNTANYNLRVI